MFLKLGSMVEPLKYYFSIELSKVQKKKKKNLKFIVSNED